LLGLLLDREDGGDMIVRNIAWLSTDYTASYPRRQNYPRNIIGCYVASPNAAWSGSCGVSDVKARFPFKAHETSVRFASAWVEKQSRDLQNRKREMYSVSFCRLLTHWRGCIAHRRQLDRVFFSKDGVGGSVWGRVLQYWRLTVAHTNTMARANFLFKH
jgi:hypothetical protein